MALRAALAWCRATIWPTGEAGDHQRVRLSVPNPTSASCSGRVGFGRFGKTMLRGFRPSVACAGPTRRASSPTNGNVKGGVPPIPASPGTPGIASTCTLKWGGHQWDVGRQDDASPGKGRSRGGLCRCSGDRYGQVRPRRYRDSGVVHGIRHLVGEGNLEVASDPRPPCAHAGGSAPFEAGHVGIGADGQGERLLAQDPRFPAEAAAVGAGCEIRALGRGPLDLRRCQVGEGARFVTAQAIADRPAVDPARFPGKQDR